MLGALSLAPSLRFSFHWWRPEWTWRVCCDALILDWRGLYSQILAASVWAMTVHLTLGMDVHRHSGGKRKGDRYISRVPLREPMDGKQDPGAARWCTLSAGKQRALFCHPGILSVRVPEAWRKWFLELSRSPPSLFQTLTWPLGEYTLWRVILVSLHLELGTPPFAPPSPHHQTVILMCCVLEITSLFSFQTHDLACYCLTPFPLRRTIRSSFACISTWSAPPGAPPFGWAGFTHQSEIMDLCCHLQDARLR